MKTILLSPRSVLAWLMLLMVALSCKDEEQPKPLGQVVFWTASKTLGGSYIEVFLKNQSIGKITSYQPYAPDCDESRYVTAKLEAGTHDFTATGEDGTKFSGRVSVQENGCTDYEFVDRNPGGGTGGGGSTVANFTYSPSQNLTAPVKIAFTNTSKNAETYRWDFGDGTTSTEANPAKEFTKAGTYKIKLTATGKTTSADYSADITVNAAVLSTTPVADFTYSPSSNLTAPVKITFTNTSKNATSYQWGFGDGTTSTAVSPTKEFTKAGDYSVKLTATDAKNQTAQKTVTIPVKAAAVLPVADWTWTASNLKVTFTNQSKNATSYTWNFNDGTTSTTANPTHDYAKAGTYTVPLTASDGKNQDQDSKLVTISAPVVAKCDWAEWAKLITVTKWEYKTPNAYCKVNTGYDGSSDMEVKNLSTVGMDIYFSIKKPNGVWDNQGFVSTGSGGIAKAYACGKSPGYVLQARPFGVSSNTCPFSKQ